MKDFPKAGEIVMEMKERFTVDLQGDALEYFLNLSREENISLPKLIVTILTAQANGNPGISLFNSETLPVYPGVTINGHRFKLGDYD